MSTHAVHRWLRPLMIWRARHISERVYMLILSVLVGVAAGLMAVLLKTSVRAASGLLEAGISEPKRVFAMSLYPIVGIGLTALFTKFFLNGNLGRGIAPIIYNTVRDGSVVPRSKTYSQLVTAFLTVTFGGSAGMEAPISVTGAALGSNMARILHLDRRRRRLLTGCGAAAGVAAIFNSPIAGVLFAVETILLELPAQFFIPLLISSATATVVSKALYVGQPFVLITTGWPVDAVPFYLLLGVFTAFFSVYMIRTYHWFDQWFARWPGLNWRKVLIGGGTLGALIFLFPTLYGEGYNMVELLLRGEAERLTDGSIFSVYRDSNPALLLVLVFFSMMLKVVATSVTVGGGGNGGMFGSSLFTGAMAGFFFARLINMSGLVYIPEVHFVVLGMAGTLSGVIHTPLTAIFLIAEITGGYALFVPLMVVSSSSYLIVKYFEPYSVYTRKLTQQGVDVYANRDSGLLAQLDPSKLLKTDFLAVRPDTKLGELVDVFRSASRNLFPVVADSGELLGVVSLDLVRHALFDNEQYAVTEVRELMQDAPAIVGPADDLENTLALMARHGAWALPVCEENGHYLGFILKSDILSRYRKQVIMSSEQ